MPISISHSVRTQFFIYALAFFTGNMLPILSVILPLWALLLGASPAEIGLIISSRQILAVLLSIHGGALLDRFDPRRVILVLGIAAAITACFYPVLPFVWAAVLLQMLLGFAETTNWIGAQSLVGRLLQGSALHAGRMAASARAGGFLGPVMAGLAWESAGPYGAFGFVAFWILCGVLMAQFLPPTEPPAPSGNPADSAPGPAPVRVGLRSLLPNPADYKATFALLVLPVVSLVVGATFMRQAGSGIQSSFYGVWLSEAGFSAALIGMLIGVGSLVSAAAALSTGALSRRFNEHWLLLAMIFLAIVSIAITPMLDTVALLFVAISLRGIGQGLNLPLMLSISSRAVGGEFQGRVAALRITFNRFGSMLVPLIMGVVAEYVGLEAAFYLVGLCGMVFTAMLAVWLLRQRFS